jgi:hypothetical protein
MIQLAEKIDDDSKLIQIIHSSITTNLPKLLE